MKRTRPTKGEGGAARSVLIVEGDPFMRRALTRLASDTDHLYIVDSVEEAQALIGRGLAFDDVLCLESHDDERWLRGELCRRAA